MKATFFITGINLGKGAIDDPTYGWDKVVKRMVADGHQVASHTWSHADLSKITREQRRDELVKLEMAMRNILGNGYIPTYIRPPYSSCTAECKSDLKALGYVCDPAPSPAPLPAPAPAPAPTPAPSPPPLAVYYRGVQLMARSTNDSTSPISTSTPMITTRCPR